MMESIVRSDWIDVELGLVCEKAQKVKRKEMPPTDTFFYLDIGGLNNEANRIDNHKIYTWEQAPSRAQQLVKVGDVLFSTVRTYLKNIAPVTDKKYEGQICSSGFTVIRGKGKLLESRYALYLSLYEDFLHPLNELQTGTSYPAVRDSDVFAQVIPLAPFPEQRAIVAKIDQLFSRLDYGIASFKAAQEKLAIYRQSVLKKAFEGELTREWREQQTSLPDADELLKQIKTELDDYHQQQLRDWQVDVKAWKAAGKEGKKPLKPKKYKVITELTRESLSRLPELPNEWCWQKLGSVCQQIQIGPFGSQMHRHEYVEKGVPVVNPQHIKSQKIFPQVFISEEKAKSLPQYVLEENDIVLGRRGEMGRSACISPKEKGWFCGSGSLFIRLGNRFNGLLYSLILSERRVVHYLEEKGSGTTMTNLNSTILSELPIQLIPLNEQAQITKEIESRFSVCDHLQQAIEQGLQKAETLRQSVLKKAFEGRLLTEAELDNCRAAPDWEPAQQLLARIQSEKSVIAIKAER